MKRRWTNKGVREVIRMNGGKEIRDIKGTKESWK
jgi:hypothetical protein